MNDILTVEQLEEEIMALCQKRSEILYQEGIEEAYLVFDNTNLCLNKNVWVLDPDYDKDLIKTVFDEMDCSAEERERYISWLAEYNEDSCTKKCVYTDTPRCCNVCPEKRDCEEALSRCGNLNKINGIEDCERRGKYEGNK